tara:strand:+ start:102 stop:221 length:120 start_codon:yes stop_codon:yes gene_type:complete
MIVLREEYKGKLKHNYTQDILKLLKEHENEYFNKYFIEE